MTLDKRFAANDPWNRLVAELPAPTIQLLAHIVLVVRASQRFKELLPGDTVPTQNV